MLYETIDKLIMGSMKAHNEVRIKTLRAIKNEFLKWKTAKENAGKELDESTEINLIKKMIKTRTESADLYEQAGRIDLAESEKQEIEVLEEFIPRAATEEEIINTFILVVKEGHITPIKKNMGMIIKRIKDILPNADGAMVAKIVKSNLV